MKVDNEGLRKTFFTKISYIRFLKDLPNSQVILYVHEYSARATLLI